ARVQRKGRTKVPTKLRSLAAERLQTVGPTTRSSTPLTTDRRVARVGGGISLQSSGPARWEKELFRLRGAAMPSLLNHADPSVLVLTVYAICVMTFYGVSTISFV